jgi:drug/metabolite transporter (DMT)-like permease
LGVGDAETPRRPDAGTPPLQSGREGAALGALALLNLLWGGSLPATKVALEGFGPLTLAALRLLIASALFLPCLPRLGARRLGRGYLLRVGALGVVGFTGTQALQAVGAAGTSAAAAAVLASTGPLWIALLAPIVLRERPRPLALVGLVVALAGVVLVALPEGRDAVGPDAGRAVQASGSAVSQAILLLSSAAFALYSLLGRLADREQPALTFVGVGCVGGALAALPLAALELVAGAPRPGALSWAMAGYLGAVVTFAGFVVWFWGLRRVPATRAAPMLFLQPLSGLVLAALVLRDALPALFLGGTGLVLVGVYLAARR